MYRQCDTDVNHTNVLCRDERLLIQINTEISEPEEGSSPGKKLHYQRVLREISAEQLGEMAGQSKGYVINLEKGFNPIFYEDAVVLGRILNIDPEYFLDEYTRFCRIGYGTRIKKIRAAHGLSQAAFAGLLSVTRSTVSIWEIENKNHHPNRAMYEKLKELARVKGVEINDT